MSLRVAIDVTPAVTQRAGVGRYTRELVRALAGLAAGPRLCPFYLAPRALYPLDEGIDAVGLKRSIRAWRLEMLARHLARWPAAGPWDGAQVYHAPDVVYPPVRRLPIVATVHDLSYVVFPRYHTRLNGGYLRLMTPLAVRRARLIIADSEATRRDLLTYYRLAPERIRVVRPGLAPAFAERPVQERIDAARERHNLPAEFILSVGTLEPRKNLHGTLSAYRLLRERLPDAPQLALVGASGWRLDEQSLLGERDAGMVRRLGYVSDDDLAALYAACSAFVYPSYYEGWGLPVAEAMALGAPVITSSVSSLPEVAGDAALLADPHSPDAIAMALQQALTDAATARRLRQAGPARAAEFSAEAWARATLAVYREAAEG